MYFCDALESDVFPLLLFVCCDCAVARIVVCSAQPQHKTRPCVSFHTAEYIHRYIYQSLDKRKSKAYNYRLLSMCLSDNLHLTSHCRNKTVHSFTHNFVNKHIARWELSQAKICFEGTCLLVHLWDGMVRKRTVPMVAWQKFCTSSFLDFCGVVWLDWVSVHFLAMAPLLDSALCEESRPFWFGLVVRLVSLCLVSLGFVLLRSVSLHCWGQSIIWLCVVSCVAKHIRRQLLTEIMETCFLFVFPVAK